ncbi:hypothetical protein DOY81_003105 [Sarcophaga bullata]|nr:hypothetical protein DOY81_003105 [Sarcophaga bullata]
MASTKLKEDLENCLITFDRRVLLTELLDDYDLPYEEVNQVVTNHLKQQENKGELKYEKRYVVYGVQEGEHKKEIYKIVAETKLKEWLKKLKNSESSLYSVEVVGGAKAAADIFKPMKVNENVKIKDRTGVRATTINGSSSAAVNTIENKPIKVETKNPFQATSTNKTTAKSPSKAKTPTKSVSQKTVSPPADKKSATKKGGINNFFSPATQKKVDTETKSSKSVVKPSTPKKMQDYFKKQTEKPKTSPKESSKKNTSIQLFDSEEEEEKQDPEEVSSDEEEKIEALKRDIISSDVEMDEDTEETDNNPSTSSKRRRILDSDDEESEDPPIKQEKLEIKEEIKEDEGIDEKVEEPETYLDEEGFVITKKPKQKAATHKATPAIRKTPPVTMKTSPKESKKTTPTGSKDIYLLRKPHNRVLNYISKLIAAKNSKKIFFSEDLLQ